MKKILKQRLTQADLFLIAVNLLPVYGVLFKQWDPWQVFLVYCMESVIIGAYNIIRMLLTSWVIKKDDWVNEAGQATKTSGLFFVFFFMVHYGFFVFGQLTLFFSITNYKDIGSGPSSVVKFLFHFPEYMSGNTMWLLLAFVVSYGILMLKDFVLSGKYQTASLNKLMMEPYPRIIVQQFAVILGGLFLLLGAGKIFIVVFALIKTFFEVAIDFDKLLQSKKEDYVSKA